MSKALQKKVHLTQSETSSSSGDSSVQFADSNLAQLKQNNHDEMFGTQEEPSNDTGLPDDLKSGVEELSGQSMDDVSVHRNSSEPEKMGAHAFAQGADIHLGSGQEKHLPHEAWHVAQQKQGRVKPTAQMKGKTLINDDPSLEKEADVMGTKAMQAKSKSTNVEGTASSSISTEKSPMQAKVHQLVGDDYKGGVESYQKEIYSTLGGVDLSAAKGYKEKKALLESTVREQMKKKGASAEEVQETLSLPLIDHRISILSRGSKTKKLAEGIEVQHIQSEKFNAFLDNIGAKTGGEVHAAPLKNYARMKAKEEDKYEGDIGRIKDVIRASFLFDKLEDIGKAQDTIASMGTHKVVEVKNRFDVSKAELAENLNYRDVIFIVENDQITGSPVKIELQLHLSALHEAKTKSKASFPSSAHHKHVMNIAGTLGLNKGKIGKNQYTGHDFYKVIRELTKSKDPFEQEIVEAAKTQSRKIYGGAWDDYKLEDGK